MNENTPYYTIEAHERCVGEYPTEAAARYARRRLYGCRARAHPIVRITGEQDASAPDTDALVARSDADALDALTRALER